MIWWLVLVTAAAAGCARDEVPAAPLPAIRAALDAPADAELGAGDDILDAAIAPDGTSVVVVATSGGVPRLWRRALDADRAEPIAGTDGAAMPAWKRTGNVVSFFAGGRLQQVTLADAARRDLAPAPAALGASWLPDGSLLYAADPRGPIRRLRQGTASDATTLRGGDVGHSFPEAVGDAGDFLYVAQVAGGRRVVRLVRNGSELDLTRTSGHAAMIGDVLVHVADGALTTQRFDREQGSLTGKPERLAFDVGVTPAGRAFFAASPRVIAWAAAAPRARELTWLDPGGTRTGALAEPADYWQVRLSPDDRLAAVTMVDPLLRTLDVFVLPAAEAATAARRLTLSLSADSDPVWSPDGARIAFRSMQGGQPNLFSRPPQFSAQQDEALLRSELDETPSDWRVQRTGPALLLFHAPGNGTGLDVWALDVASGERTPVARGGFNESDARWSPDGAWIAYVSDEAGRPDVFVERWPPDGQKRRVTTAGGTRPRWRRDGRGLFFLRDGVLMEAAFAGGGFATARRIADLAGVRDYEPAHRSDRLLAILPVARARPAAARLIIGWQQ